MRLVFQTYKLGNFTSYLKLICIFVNKRMCHALHRGYLNSGIFKAFVFPVSLYWESPSGSTVHPQRWKTEEKKNNHALSYQNYSTNTGSCTQWKPASQYSIFWLVSQHCYNALLCIWAVFFSTHECQRGNKKRCLVCSGLLTANDCCHIRAPLSS